MQYKLVVVILTYNESIHIARAIQNVSRLANKIIVLDSHSQDDTVEIAKNLGADIIFRKFDDYKNQRQYAIDYCKNITEWMLFLDADEYLLDELKVEIKEKTNASNHIVGYYLSRRAIFMGRWIKYGGYYPTYLLRLFKPETARLAEAVNEHVTVTGHVETLKNDFVDHNLKSIAFWVDKHNKYTNIEARNLFMARTTMNKNSRLNFRIQSDRKKWIRQNIWNQLPVLIRPLIYFIYRYIFRLGFLDGKEGFIYHVLQGGFLWFLVDVKYLELKK